MQYSSPGFTYQGIPFNQHSFNLILGLNAVDSKENVEKVFAKLKEHNLGCARMGAYKPRTKPESFQGLREKCLPYVFELAGKYGIKVIAMEVTCPSQIIEINLALKKTGNPTGIVLQIGTRNAQNYELLQACGEQTLFPVLYKRGYGITLDESLNAVRYITNRGNNKVIFCLRGVKSLHAAPHRNLVDFSQIGVIARETNFSICCDPSHSVGNRDEAYGIKDIYHVAAQAVISGANSLLVDVHPNPKQALVDAKQALTLDEIDWFIEDMDIARRAYLARLSLSRRKNNLTAYERITS